MSETANSNVDSETGSLESMGSGLDSISCWRMSSTGDGSGELPGAAPTCSKLRETVQSEVNTSISGMGNLDSMGSGLESIPCSGMSSVGATTSSGKGDPPCAAPSGYTCWKLSETANLEANTFASFGESPTHVAPGVSPADARASERSYQQAETIGASKTLPGTLGFGPSWWMLLRVMLVLCPKVCWVQ